MSRRAIYRNRPRSRYHYRDDDESNSSSNDSDSNSQDESDSEGYLEEIDHLLSNISVAGDFYIGAELQHPIYPGLYIKKIGHIGLPLTEHQTKQVIKLCEQAPFGKKEKTIVDTSVRNTWQLNPSQFQLKNPKWDDYLEIIKQEVARGLGVSSSIELHLYKLLLYETGGFFKPHRDTEKEDNMFATLVVQLPTEHEGGQLVIKHKDKKKVFDFGGKESNYNCYYAAFYADCEHEVKPVKSGYRINLVYNVVYTGSGNVPSALNLTAAAELGKLIDKWEEDKESKPTKLIKILDHKYTTAGFSFQTLKGADRAIADTLKKVAEEKDLLLYLGLVTVSESGYQIGYDEFETNDSTIEIENLTDVNDKEVNLGSLSDIDEEELLPRQFMRGVDWDSEEVNEATGNEGTTMERWYKRLALVFLPKSQEYNFLGVPAITAKLKELVANCGKKMDKKTKAYKEAAAFANDVVTQMKGKGIFGHYEQLLELLKKLDLVAPFIHVLKLKGTLDLAAVSEFAERHGWKHFTSYIIKNMNGSTTASKLTILATCAGYKKIEGLKPVILEDSEQLSLCQKLAKTIIDSWSSSNSYRSYSWMNRAPDNIVDQVVQMLKLLYIIDSEDLVNTFVNEKLGDLELKNLMAVHTAYRSWLGSVPSAHLAELSKYTLKKIKERQVNLVVSSSSGWTVPTNTISCNCGDCAEFKRFLASPSESVWHMKIVHNRRQHIERCGATGVFFQTERSGSPQMLICTKDKAAIDARINGMKAEKALLEGFVKTLEEDLNNNNTEEARPVKKQKKSRA